MELHDASEFNDGVERDECKFVFPVAAVRLRADGRLPLVRDRAVDGVSILFEYFCLIDVIEMLIILERNE